MRALLALVCLPGVAAAAITVNGVADQSYYTDSASFTVVADAGFEFAATLDGVGVPAGSPVAVGKAGFHLLQVSKTPAGGGTAETRELRFIVRASERGSSESGLPPWTPHPIVADAASAFASGSLKLIAPSAWPVGMELPVVATLSNGSSGEGLRLNGRVALEGLSGRGFWLRRGWGSRLMPALATAGPVDLGGKVQGLVASRAVNVEAVTAWTEVSGSIGDSTWPANSRIHVTGTLTIAAGSTLAIGAGSIVKLDPGVEVVANGTLEIDGTVSEPVVFTPRSASEAWGGIELNLSSSRVNASGTIFTGAGADPTWFSSHSGYSSHRKEQALFLVGAAGAELHTADVWMIDLKGQAMNSRAGAVIDLQRTLIQRCTSGGELNGSTVTVDRSAVVEIPSADATFVDGDNDGLYFTNGTQTVSRSVIGWTKDDGIDSGADGGAGTVTTLQGNWYESVYHEGQSLSGRRSVLFSGCVFTDCGQGVECGYGASGGGPLAVVEGCAFIGNLNGARYGDNYDWDYNGTLEVRDSILAHNAYHDVWGYDWTSWSYNSAPVFTVHDSLLGTADSVNHPDNELWNPELHAAQLAPFMPVPGSDVGIAVLAPEVSLGPAAYPGSFPVRLSSFSSRAVSATWTLSGAMDSFAPLQSLASGSVSFQPGETLKTIVAPLAGPGNYAKLVLVLSSPVAAEITGPAVWFIRGTASPDPVLIAKGSSGWRCREARSDPPASWKSAAFDDSSPAATEWQAATLPAGFGSFSGVSLATTLTAGSASDRTRTFYFRKSFTLADPAELLSLTLKIRRDDGVLAWLNDGAQPVANSTDGSALPVPAAYATLSSNATNVSDYHSFSIPLSQLVAGANLLAIELHQSSITSSDALLDVELVAEYRRTLTLSQAELGERSFLYWEAMDATLEESADLQGWEALPELPGVFEVPPLTEGSRYYRLKRE